MKKDHMFASPVAPGDPLWWASETASGGPGPTLIQARMSEDAVDAVLFSKDGLKIITDDGNSKELLNSQYACVDETACLEWIKENMPDAVLLDGRIVKALHIGTDGKKRIIDAVCSVQWIEDLFSSSSLASVEPDCEGNFPVYIAGSGPEDSAITTIIRDKAGNPVGAIYGELLLFRKVRDETAGMDVMADISQAVIDNASRTATDPDTPEYDPDVWTSAPHLTVGMLKDFLGKFPDSDQVCCCGAGHVFLHRCQATGVISIDCDGLDDLPEYEGRDPVILTGAEA